MEYASTIGSSENITLANNTGVEGEIMAINLKDSKQLVLNNNSFNMIYCDGLDTCYFFNNTVSGQIWTSVYISGSTHLTFVDNSFEDGIFFSQYSTDLEYWNHIMTDNTVNGKQLGYFVNKSNLIIDGTAYGQIALVNCTDSSIDNGVCNDVSTPISIAFSRSCNVTDVNIERSREYSIIITKSNSTSVEGVTISDIYNSGIMVYQSLDTLVSRNSINDLSNIHGSVSAIEVKSSNSSVVEHNRISGSDEGISVSYCIVKVENNTVSNGNWGDIAISSDYPCEIMNNTLTNGIWISASESTFNQDRFNHTFIDNVVAGKQFGFFFRESDLSINGSLYGQMMLIDCDEVVVSGMNTVGVTNAVEISWSRNCGITQSFLEADSYAIDITGSTNCFVTESRIEGGVGLAVSSNIECTNFNISTNTVIGEANGIYFSGDDSFISKNSVSSAYYGIALGKAANNTISSNTLYQSKIGVQLDNEASNNFLYYNKFAYSDFFQALDYGDDNVWDDGISRGNFWSDYSGTGVYNISGNPSSVDRYPHSLVEANPPLITDQENQTIVQGNPDAHIRWKIADTNPLKFEIHVNNSLEVADSWDGSDIVFDLSTLEIGVYKITLTVYDELDFSDTDSVIIKVVAELNTTTTTTVTSTTATTTTTLDPTTTNTSDTTDFDFSQFLGPISLMVTFGSIAVVVVVLILFIRSRHVT
jgi:parallel beta-helix repeat protein